MRKDSGSGNAGWLRDSWLSRVIKSRAADKAANAGLFPCAGLEALEPRVLMHGVGDLPDGIVIDPDTGVITITIDENTEVHQDDAGKLVDHLAMLALVPYADVTHVAVQSGAWSDPETWGNETLPTPGARVLIPHDVAVTFDIVNETDWYKTVRVDGELRFDHTQNTRLRVDTLIVAPSGSLHMGTELNPVGVGVKATIAIVDDGPIDTSWDPLLLSRGLISHGNAEFYGAEVTPYVTLAQEPLAGETELILSEVPVNWKVGDRLILPGTKLAQNQDEQLSILAISGNQVTVSPLAYSHTTPADGLSVYLTNVSRNVSVISETPEVLGRRGHTMFMHADSVEIHNAGFYGLGRTDKSVPLTDPKLDINGNLIPSTAQNPRGRYAVHFHKHGVIGSPEPVLVTGSVVVDSPGWGYVNHNSHVIFEDNVAFNVVGAAFVTEDGSELGAFRRNLTIRSTGTGAPSDFEARESILDFGFNGHGFWFQGVGGIEIEDNIASGHNDAAFAIFPCRCNTIDTVLDATFVAENLLDPSIANGESSIGISDGPARIFRGNVVFASVKGFESWFHLRFADHDTPTIIEDMTLWEVRNAAVIPYISTFVFRDWFVIGPGISERSTAFPINGRTARVHYENLHVEGFETAIIMPTLDANHVIGGYYNNKTNIVVGAGNTQNEGLENIQTIINVQAGPETVDHIAVIGAPKLNGTEDLPNFFTNKFSQAQVFIDGERVYYPNQAADFVPFPADTAPGYVPAELIDKTNQQLWDQYSLTVGGVLGPAVGQASSTSESDGGELKLSRRSRVNRRSRNTTPTQTPSGNTSPAVRPTFILNSPTYTSQIEGYVLSYKNKDGNVFTDAQPVDLNQGWNVVTRVIDGNPYGFLVFGVVQPPDFVLTQTPAINPQAVSQGILLVGTRYDDINGSRGVTIKFNGATLASLPVQARADGSQFLLLNFTVGDRAGNETAVAVEVELDPSIPFVSVKRGRQNRDNNEPPIVVVDPLSDTLVSLLELEFTDRRDR